MSFFRKKWKMHLYLNGVYVGKVRINETEKPSDNVYIVHIWFKQQIYKSIHVKSIVHPTKLLYNDNKNKITHWNFEYEEGIDV